VYFVKSSLFESLLLNAVGGLSISSTFDNFITYKVFDLGGIFFYLSLSALFVFLTIQTVQKRRWS
jgi:ABC-2 type transport system permease protein